MSTRAFRVDRWRSFGARSAPAGNLLVVTCLDGRGAAAADGDRVALERGRSFVVPATTRTVGLEGDGLDLLVASTG